MATKRQNSIPDLAAIKASEVLNKQRIKELEEEVSNLKKKLDDLRKAKNTTITKREREIVEVGAPFSKRESKEDLKLSGLEKKLDTTDKQHDKEMYELRKKLSAEMESFKKSNQKEGNCNHDAEFTMLRTRIEELEADNAALRVHGEDLMEKVKSLQSDLSVKEANWCQNEEKLKLQLKLSLGEKYKEWMNTTESKIEDLQKTNDMLRGYLKNKK